MRGGALGDQARDSWAQAYKASELCKGSSNGQHFGACPHCGGDDRFWIHFSGDHASTFSCRGCEPRKGTDAAREIARALNDLAGYRPTPPGEKWQIIRTHEYRTSKGTVRHVKGIPPGKTKATTFWQHRDGGQWKRKMGGKVRMGDLLWNHWTVKPEHTSCVVCEGEKDATELHILLKDAWPTTCFVSGAGGADTPRLNLTPLAHISSFYVLFDADKAGRAGAVKYARAIQEARPEATVRHYAPPGESGEDWGDVVEKTKRATSDPSKVVALVTEQLVEAMERAVAPVAHAHQNNGATDKRVLDVGEAGEKAYDWETIPLGWTDAELAKWILGDKLGGRQENGLFVDAPVIYDQSQKEWYFCRGGVWRETDFPKAVAGFMEEAREIAVEAGVGEKLVKALSSNFQREQVLKTIQRYVAERGERVFDQSSWLVCGSPPEFSVRAIIDDPAGEKVDQPAQVWDLQTGRLRDAAAGDFIRHTLGTPLPSQGGIDPMERGAGRLGMQIAKDCPEFWELLAQISSFIPDIDADGAQPQNDHDWMLHMCEWIGQCLTADTSPEKFLFLTGTGGNGKGFLTELLLKLAGSLGHVAPDGLLNPKRTAHRQEQAVLEGKHLLVADEQRARIDTGLLKNWSGGTPITADHKGGKSITFPVKFTMVLLSNQMPRFPSANYAMERRLVGIPFDMSFKDKGSHFQRRAKEDIFRSVEKELPRIAYLCLAMYRAVKLRGNQFSPCARVDAKSTELLLNMNRVQEWIESCLHIGPDHAGVSTKDMYATYKAFMKDNSYRGLLPHKTFTAEVRAVALQKSLDITYRRVGPREARVWGFRGCSLKATFPDGSDRNS